MFKNYTKIIFCVVPCKGLIAFGVVLLFDPLPSRVFNIVKQSFWSRSQNYIKLRNVSPSARQFAWNNSPPTGRSLMKFDILIL